MIIAILASLAVIVLLFYNSRTKHRRKDIHPNGYFWVPYNAMSSWAKAQCRRYRNEHAVGFRYFSGKTYNYAVYYYKNGRYIIYRKKKAI